MEVGLRVVRGPDWIWGNQDGGEGNIGTVVHAGDGGGLSQNTVLVCWDNGHQANYRTGHAEAYDLKVVDSSLSGNKHNGYTCEGCSKEPIEGMLWHCEDCLNFDLCTVCYTGDKHNLEHSFQRRDKPGDSFISVGKRLGATKVQLLGIFKDAKVCRGRDWQWGDQDGGPGKEGRVLEVVSWSGVPRAGARVSWGFFRATNNCRLGYEGKVDLKCVSATSGGSYYRDHLPKLGEALKTPPSAAAADENQIKVGDSVVINLDVELLKATAEGHGGWVPSMEKVIGKVGVVETIDVDGDVHARWGITTWAFHPAVFTKVKSSPQVQRLRAGDKVRVIPNKERVMVLQEGHGGWNESMTEALGQEGRVMEVDGDGDAVVIVGSRLWLFNSAALLLESAEKDREPEGQQSSARTSDLKTELLASLFAELLLSGDAGSPGDRLVNASSRGDLAKVKEILESNADKVNHKRAGKTALHVACHQGKADVVSFLLSKGADKDLLDEQDYTALHHAAYGDDSGQTVRVMLNNGANVNVNSNKNRSTPLHLAVAQDKRTAVEILTQFRHSNVNAQDSYGDTPLHDAILKEKGQMFDIILNSADLDVSVCNSKGFNPLHLACLKGYHHAVEKLTERFPGLVDIPKEDGFTALHLATYNNHTDIARTLLLTGHCSIEFKTNKGQTALMLATERTYTTVIELLVEHGSEINAEDEDGDTALHMAVMVQSVSALGELAQAIGLPMGTDVRTGSATACYLVMHGADVQHLNHDGKTPLDLCVDPAVRSLVQQFVKPELQPPPQPRPQAPHLARVPATRGVTTGASNATSRLAPTKCAAAINDPSLDINLRSSGPDVKDSPSAFAAQSPRPPPPTSPQPISPTAGECIICKENFAAVTFKPCGHRITCTGCSVRVKRCLSCHTDIEQKISPEGAPLTTSCLGLESYMQKCSALQERLHQMERGMECSICMERQRNVVFQCGHGTCQECSLRLELCHVCRKEIISRIQTY